MVPRRSPPTRKVLRPFWFYFVLREKGKKKKIDDDGLNAKERTFVAANKIPLRQFLKLRDGVLREYEKRSGKLERKTVGPIVKKLYFFFYLPVFLCKATRIYRNESQKAGRVYDFLAENGQITAS